MSTTRYPNGITFGSDLDANGYLTSICHDETTGLLHGAGTSTLPITTATANKNFLDYKVKTTAASGDTRGLYMRLYLGGTTAGAGYGDAVRAYTTVTGTGYAYASGVHATMSIAAGATVTGSGAGARCTLEAAAETRTLSGNVAALQLDSNIGANNTVPATAAFIRLAKIGTVDLATFMNITDDQCLKGDGTLGASASDALKCLLPNGSVVYIPLYAAG